MQRLELELHPDKTKLVNMDGKGFDFLGSIIRKAQKLKGTEINETHQFPSRNTCRNEDNIRWFASRNVVAGHTENDRNSKSKIIE